MEGSLGPLQEHARHAQRTRHFMADDHAAHGGGDDRADLCLDLRRDFRGHRLAQPGGARRVHQDARTLQIAWAAQARGQDEMPFEQRLGGAELGEDVVIGHAGQLRQVIWDDPAS